MLGPREGVSHHPLQSACVPKGCASVSRDCASFPRTVPGPGAGEVVFVSPRGCQCPQGLCQRRQEECQFPKGCASFPRAVPGPQQGSGVPGVRYVAVVSPVLAPGCAAACQCPRGCSRSPGDAGVPGRMLVLLRGVLLLSPERIPGCPAVCQCPQVCARPWAGLAQGSRDSTGGSPCRGGTESPSGGPRCYWRAKGAIGGPKALSGTGSPGDPCVLLGDYSRVSGGVEAHPSHAAGVQTPRRR